MRIFRLQTTGTPPTPAVNVRNAAGVDIGDLLHGHLYEFETTEVGAPIVYPNNRYGVLWNGELAYVAKSVVKTLLPIQTEVEKPPQGTIWITADELQTAVNNRVLAAQHHKDLARLEEEEANLLSLALQRGGINVTDHA